MPTKTPSPSTSVLVIVHHKIDKLGWIFQRIRMMLSVRLVDHLENTPQCLVPTLRNRGILGDWDNLIPITNDVDDRNTCLSQRSQIVDGITLVR